MKYAVKLEITKYMIIMVDAVNTADAEIKAHQGEGQVFKDEFLLPSTDWKTIEIKELDE